MLSGLRPLASWNTSHAFLREKIGQGNERILLFFSDAWFFLAQPGERSLVGVCPGCLWLPPPDPPCLWSSLQDLSLRRCLWSPMPTTGQNPAGWGGSWVSLCSWVPASGLILLEECVICTDFLWGLRVGGHSGTPWGKESR